jgi:DNA polymerase-3 subunit chi
MAPRIDFYVLEGADERARLACACRVIEKAFLQHLTVCVNLGTPAETDAFDALLWTFADRSFVPHERARDASAIAAAPPGSPVWVGCRLPVAAGLLVNLAPEAPEFYAQYARIAEFVDGEPGRRDAGRRRFAFYREHGHAPETHKLTT